MAEYDLSGMNLPFSLDAEQSVLGAVLMDQNAMTEVIGVLHPEHFYVELNRSIYAVLVQMNMSSQSIDIITVLENVMRQGLFETAEQAKEYLAKLMQSVPSISSVAKYAEIIRDKILGNENENAPVFNPSRSILAKQLFINGLNAAKNLVTPTVPRCPHMGCALKKNKEENAWECPCHGSRFTENGDLLEGPANSGLEKK